MNKYIGIGGGLLLLTMAVMFISLIIGAFLQILICMHFGIPLYNPILVAAGASLAACGFMFNFVAASHMARAVRAGELATAGPYAHSRNPMYASLIFLIIPGIAVALHNALMLLVVPPLMRWYFLAHIEVEETYLDKRFGAAYREYCRRVPRLFPGQ